MDLPQALCVLLNANFTPNDGVSTSCIINYPIAQAVFPDYLVEEHIIGSTTYTTRWFILEGVRTRGGQYELTLRRDVVADFQEYILNAPCFIEKATLQSDDNFIFNSENMTFNQIKTSETLLKDKTRSPWLVLYMAKGWNSSGGIEQQGTIQIPSQTADYTVESGDYSNWELYFPQSAPLKMVKNYGPAIAASSQQVLGLADFYQGYINVISNSVNATAYGGNEPERPLRWARAYQETPYYYASTVYGNYIKQLIDDNPELWAQIKTQFNDYYINQGEYYNTNSSKWSDIQEANGKILLADGKYYKISFVAGQTTRDVNKNGAIPLNSNLATSLTELINRTPTGYEKRLTGTPGATSFWNWIEYQEYYTVLTELPPGSTDTITYNYNFTNVKATTLDAPWDILCMPYSSNIILGLTTNKNNIEVVDAFASQLRGTSFCYDAQILPYCPIPKIEANAEVVGDDTRIRGPASPEEGITIYRSTGTVNTPCSFLYVAKSSKIYGSLSYTISISDYKIESQTDLYRLSSPNYSASFDFNAAKNGGVIGFEYACTMMPLNPFVYVHPIFGRLYGDNGVPGARGLICSGDFGLPMWTDQWKQYQVNNKNFQQSFDRQIQNMEFNNNMARIEEGVGLVTSTIGGAISGATTGAIMSGMNPVGAAAGAAIGGATSFVGGVADFVINEAKRAEAIDFARDQFGYTLGNIRALPNTLSRTTAFTNINKYFPVLEYYTCSDEEKQALRDKIKYNGMTVMRIGTIGQFIRNERTYIKGKIIRIENFPEDTHVLNAIAEEINKGVFI